MEGQLSSYSKLIIEMEKRMRVLETKPHCCDTSIQHEPLCPVEIYPHWFAALEDFLGVKFRWHWEDDPKYKVRPTPTADSFSGDPGATTRCPQVRVWEVVKEKSVKKGKKV